MSQGFFDAIKPGDLAKIEEFLLLDPGLASMKSEGGTSAVLVAAYNNQAEIARLLAARGGALNIFEAAAVGDLGCGRELIQQDAELVNAYAADGFQPLGQASFFGHLSIVELLLSNGADVNSLGEKYARLATALRSGAPAPRDCSLVNSPWSRCQRSAAERLHTAPSRAAERTSRDD